MTTTPSRRWFRFSLRTLFVVVTMVCVLLGWSAYQLNWIRQRHELLSRPTILEWVTAVHVPKTGRIFYLDSRPAPGLLGVFGEPGYSQLCVFDSDLAEAQRLFPEAEFVDD